MIINLSTKQIISEKERICKTMFSQARGLMFRSKQNLLMVFNKPQRISLHNFFVFYPIDIVVLNEKNVIVEIKKNFKPFTFWTSSNKGKSLLELSYPAHYKVGDVLEFS